MCSVCLVTQLPESYLPIKDLKNQWQQMGIPFNSSFTLLKANAKSDAVFMYVLGKTLSNNLLLILSIEWRQLKDQKKCQLSRSL